MLERLVLAAALCLTACGQSDKISIQVFPATLASVSGAPPDAGERVDYAGSLRGSAGLYDVSAEPLITEWSIIACKAASQPDGSRAITARLNAYGQQQMAEYTADAAAPRRYLAVKVDGRWADIGPILGPVTDRLTLYGFTVEEAERLERALAIR